MSRGQGQRLRGQSLEVGGGGGVCEKWKDCPDDVASRNDPCTYVLQQLEVTLIDHWRGEGVNSGQTEVKQLLTDCCESNTLTL